MPRYFATAEYDGGPYVGWQAQANGPTVQTAIETAIFAVTGEKVRLFAAGRTDAGVHALGQALHFDLAAPWPAERLCAGVNFHLKPAPVVLLNVTAVEDGFHARFSAVRRHYLYRIINRRPRLTLERGRAWWIAKPLDVSAMAEGAGLLTGHHDFTTFRDARCQAASPCKTLERLTVTDQGDEIRIEASARSFLHRQVRSMAGSLAWVGQSRWRISDLEKALLACDRRACGPVAPAHGLYLARVDF